MNLSAIFADLEAYLPVRAGAELPPARTGITYLWGRSGIFKRGVNQDLDLMIRIGDAPRLPGLAELAPHARYRCEPGPIPVTILDQILLHARCVGRCEQQYLVTWRGDRFEVLLPPQEGSAGSVAYTVPSGVPVLLDLHSHHEMPAFFSSTDDRDDLGLSVSAVIGALHTDRPQIIARANIYGHRQRIPLSAICAGPGLFTEREHAAAYPY